MFSSMHGLHFILSLIAVYLVISPFLEKEEGAIELDDDGLLKNNKVKLYAQELDELNTLHEMEVLGEEDYQEQKRLLLKDANKVV